MNLAFVLICFVFFLFLVVGIAVIYLVPKVISFLFEPRSGSMQAETRVASDATPSDESSSDKVKVETDAPTVSDSREPSREKKSLLSKLDIFSGKKKCSECGTELEYRDEYQSHYCPKCRTYK